MAGKFIEWSNTSVPDELDEDYLYLTESTPDIDDHWIIKESQDASIPLWYDKDTISHSLATIRVAEIGQIDNILELNDRFVVIMWPQVTIKWLPKIQNSEDKLLSLVRNALENDLSVMFVESEDHEILDAKILDELMVQEQEQTETEELSLAEISIEEALQLFRDLKAKSCIKGASASKCIPFLYPEDGCWGRAHLMYKDIRQAGFASQKIWTYKSLSVRTANTPKCRVTWGYHVAPILDVKNKGKMVFDPSLFNEPSTTEEWLNIQSGRNKNTKISSAKVFHRKSNGKVIYDTNFRRADRVQSTYRLKFLRRVKLKGWPPYSYCGI